MNLENRILETERDNRVELLFLSFENVTETVEYEISFAILDRQYILITTINNQEKYANFSDRKSLAAYLENEIKQHLQNGFIGVRK